MFLKLINSVYSSVFLLCILFGNLNCSEKYYASEVLSIFPEVKGKIVYSGEFMVENTARYILMERLHNWNTLNDTVRGQTKEIPEKGDSDKMVIKVKKLLFMDVPQRLFVRGIDRSATYFEYMLYAIISDGQIKYEVKSVKAYYYQLGGSGRAINNWHDIAEDALTPSTLANGYYVSLPVSNYLNRGNAAVMGRDNMVKFYTDIDESIKVVLASLGRYVSN